MRDVVIVSAVRTPIGKLGGGLKDASPQDLGALVIRVVTQCIGRVQGMSTIVEGIYWYGKCKRNKWTKQRKEVVGR